MAQLAIRVPIFLASSNDVLAERDAVDAVIQRLAADYSKRKVLVTPVRWERNGSPGWGRPQDLLDPLVRESELMIVILWARLGDGVAEELKAAAELISKGATDDLFVYFRSTAPASNIEGFSQMLQFKQQVQNAKQIFAWDYSTPQELAELVHRHVADWLTIWPRALDACDHAMRYSPAFMPGLVSEDRLLLLQRSANKWPDEPQLSALGCVAVEHYQTHGPKAANLPVPTERLRDIDIRALMSQAPSSDRQYPFLRNQHVSGSLLSETPDGDLYFSDSEWFFFCCAQGLTNAIIARQTQAVERLEYCNEVHQYLCELLAIGTVARGPAVAALSDWLCGGSATARKPIARNFAAYVLGMIGALEAAPALARAVEADTGHGVRFYALLALGKLRARRYLPLLIDQYEMERSPEVRLSIAQAISRTVGIVPYEL